MQFRIWIVFAIVMNWVGLLQAAEPPPATTSSATSPASPSILDELRRHAQAVEGLVRSDLAKQFLQAASELPDVSPRTIYRDKETRRWYSAKASEQLSADVRAKLEPKTLTVEDYYFTKYGSPLAYVRPLEVLAQAGLAHVKGRKILDYGYGTVGHLRMLASLGADVTGVDVDSYLPALYCEPQDQGVVRGAKGAEGRITLVDGSFPSDDATRKTIGTGYDLFISKNTLKNGYIHPAEPVDPRKLVQLGVDDMTFVRTLFEILKPGGWVLIYNICPAPAKPDKPYIPWADGRCPFPKALWESTGFRIIAFDQVDNAAVRAMAKALGWDQGEGAMDLENDLFGVYTLLQKP